MRRPIFWFLWPVREAGPLDGDAQQATWLRLCPRGPWRVAFLIVATLAIVTFAAAAVASVLAAPSWAGAGITLVIVIPIVALLARGWVAGTYVCDRGVKVSSIRSTEAIPWTSIAAIEVEARSRWLGTPLSVEGARLAILVREGHGDLRRIGTHVESASPDLWLRPQAWDAASDRLRTWLRES